MTEKLTKRAFLGQAAAAGAVAVGATGLGLRPARAESVDLVLSSWLPPRHPVVVHAIKPWAKDIETATEGRVKIRVLAKPLGSPPAHFDMARDGVADITYGLHSFTKDDRFKNSRIGQFSLLGNDAASISQAFWDVYTQDLGAVKEHEGTHLLGLFNHGPGVIHNKARPVKTADDLKGMKLRCPGGYISDLMTSFDAVTILTAPGEVYEKLSRGVIDGVTFPMDPLNSYKLAELVKYTTKVPGGIYNTTWFLVMNPGKWDKISKADQEAITKLSGKAFAKRAGEAWNIADDLGVKAAKKAGIEVIDAPAPLVEAIKAKGSVFEDKWAGSLDKGYDGKAALEKFRKMTGISA
ncbi:TRAP transporter substrate-binding protein [Acidimangrovimonas sediminis]|uniref:TRAP transporter substrate-binding protein n=1 Tax=Acidimangrovimonas sediminis TaxID=2056283 RepID=UPI000C7FFC2E|nr:TRAP transporter substrate-binding protein [Acidimangrovimonas sediminis]